MGAISNELLADTVRRASALGRTTAAPTTVATGGQPVKGGTLRYGLSTEPRRMNQLNTTWMTDATQHLYDRVLTRDLDS